MASPQLKNGFVRLANEIYDALAKYRISGEARQVMDFIIRKTYGWNKKEDVIALSQFMIGTGLKRPTVCRAINQLVHLNLIIKKDNGLSHSYRFNKDFSTWTPLSKKITKKVIHTESTAPLSKKIMGSIKKDNRGFKNIGEIGFRIIKKDTYQRQLKTL